MTQATDVQCDGHKLQHLAPVLGRTHNTLQRWIAQPKSWSAPHQVAQRLRQYGEDLRRQSAALSTTQSLLTIMLMGGTGVGKSTLFNALARAKVAPASHERPTTREPIVYYHESQNTDHFDPILKECRLVAHNRPGLEQKLLVDTPDLDSNEIANRDTLYRVIRVADVVLYVGSQEKYHDRLGWDLFLEQRGQRAFAFVLNKWDRCQNDLAGGARPDEDLVRGLREEGYPAPRLFRTCAQLWVDSDGQVPSSLPEGEEFRELEAWLEGGLTKLEVEAIKAQGVEKLAINLERALNEAMPPDLKANIHRAKERWGKELTDEADRMGNIIVAALDPHQKDIERHFRVEGMGRFRGLMAGFLQLVTTLRYLGSRLKSPLSLPTNVSPIEQEAKAKWDIATLAKLCMEQASDQHLDARCRALPNRLLVLADQAGIPVSLLTEAAERAADGSEWNSLFTSSVNLAIEEVEEQWVRPKGWRRVLEIALVRLGDVVPMASFLGSIGWLLYSYYEDARVFALTDLVLPFAVVFFVLILFYFLIIMVLPVQWDSIRGTFERHLARRVKDQLGAVYLPIPATLLENLQEERRAVEALLSECHAIKTLLQQQEQAVSVAELYGQV